MSWNLVGVVGVDGGEIYITGDVPGPQGEKRNKFIRDETVPTADGVKQVNYQLGHPGRGVISATGVGDGTFPVYVRYSKDGQPLELKINFNPRLDKIEKFCAKVQRIKKGKLARIKKLKSQLLKLNKVVFPDPKTINEKTINTYLKNLQKVTEANKKMGVIFEELYELGGEF